MMRAAGLPLDLDREQLLKQALVEARRALEGERSAREAQESELESLRTGWQCRVCFSREVDTAFSGCGHMFCAQCSRSLSKCAVCRRVSQQLKLFK
jgi:sacsin